MPELTRDTGDGPVHLEECPFCGTDLGEKAPPFHLEEWLAFFRAFDMDPPTEQTDLTDQESRKNRESKSSVTNSEAIQPAEAAGTWIGRAPSGFTVVDGQLHVDAPAFEAIVKAFERIESGESQRMVRCEIDVVHESTLRRLYADDERRQIYTEHRAPNERIKAALNGWLEAAEKNKAGDH